MKSLIYFLNLILKSNFLGHEKSSTCYEVLVASEEEMNCMRWTPAKFGEIPRNAIRAGNEDVGYNVYIARYFMSIVFTTS